MGGRHAGLRRPGGTRNPRDGERLTGLLAEGYALPDAFWAEFVARFWQRRSLVLEQPFAAPIASAEEVFACLVRAANLYRHGVGRDQFQLCIDHAAFLADLSDLLPRKADGSTEGYAERVTEAIGGRRFGLVVDDFQVFDPELWFRLRDFLTPFYSRIGTQGTKAGLFLGNYRKTPFGLHQGASSNFMFVVQGKKRIRAWPGHAFSRDMTLRLDFEPYVRRSITLDGGPGDVLYWPSTHWHIGEEVGSLTAAISVGVFPGFSLSQHLATHLGRTIAARVPASQERALPRLYPTEIVRSGAALRSFTRKAVGCARQAAASPALERAVLTGWLNHVTGIGCASVPDPLPGRRLRSGHVVRAASRHPVAWRRIGSELLCSANGHAFTTPASPQVLALLRTLEEGTPRRVAELVARRGGPPTTSRTLRGVLERLVRVRAIRVERIP